MIEIELLVQTIILCYATIFLEVGMKINSIRIFTLKIFSDFIDPIGVLAVGDGHYSSEVIVVMAICIAEAFFHTQSIAELAALSAFRFIFVLFKLSHICLIVVWSDYESDVSV